MSRQAPPLGRPADRKNSILDHLRREIAGGIWLPGCQLPTRSEISDRFGASPVTVQSALEHLRRDGFVVVRGRHGTYVAPRPPHLTNYAVVFATRPDEPGWSPFWNNFAEAARARSKEGERNLAIFHDINHSGQGADYTRLMGEVRAHKLAGIIFTANPFEVRGTPLLDEPGIPRVAIMSQADGYDMPYVQASLTSFWQKALQHLRDRGRRNVAIVSNHKSEEVQLAVEMAHAMGLRTEPHWVHLLSKSRPETACSLMQLLFHRGHSDRPDGLIIADDNMVEAALAGVSLAGATISGDVDVVAHCNFPHPLPLSQSARRLGVDAYEVLDACLAALDAQTLGKAVPQRTVVQARFEI